jgi:methionyl-tRNA synthetase
LLKLVWTNNDGEIPAHTKGGEADQEISPVAIRNMRRKVRSHLVELRLNAALDEIMAFVRSINRAIEIAAPWKTGKENPEGTRSFLGAALQALGNAAYLLYPLMPHKMALLLKNLGVEKFENLEFGETLQLPEGHLLPKRAALFPRVKLDLAPDSPSVKPKERDLITIDEFKKIKLKIARVLAVEPAPRSDKLLILKVDLGGEQRQLVAGIAERYKSEDLVGKSVVVAANLAPATIRGIESQGMLLAASDNDNLALLIPDSDVKPGSGVS